VSSALSLTSVLYGVGGQNHFPATLSPVKILHPSYRRLDGLQGRSGRLRNIFSLPGIDHRTVQPVSSLIYRRDYGTLVLTSLLPVEYHRFNNCFWPTAVTSRHLPSCPLSRIILPVHVPDFHEHLLLTCNA